MQPPFEPQRKRMWLPRGGRPYRVNVEPQKGSEPALRPRVEHVSFQAVHGLAEAAAGAQLAKTRAQQGDQCAPLAQVAGAALELSVPSQGVMSA